MVRLLGVVVRTRRPWLTLFNRGCLESFEVLADQVGYETVQLEVIVAEALAGIPKMDRFTVITMSSL